MDSHFDPDPDTDCNICMAAPTPTPATCARLAPCGHAAFHAACLRKWIALQQGPPTCTLCRARITAYTVGAQRFTIADAAAAVRVLTPAEMAELMALAPSYRSAVTLWVTPARFGELFGVSPDAPHDGLQILGVAWVLDECDKRYEILVVVREMAPRRRAADV